MRTGSRWEFSGGRLPRPPLAWTSSFSAVSSMPAKNGFLPANKNSKLRHEMKALFPAPEFAGFGPSSQDLVTTDRA